MSTASRWKTINEGGLALQLGWHVRTPRRAHLCHHFPHALRRCGVVSSLSLHAALWCCSVTMMQVLDWRRKAATFESGTGAAGGEATMRRLARPACGVGLVGLDVCWRVRCGASVLDPSHHTMWHAVGGHVSESSAQDNRCRLDKSSLRSSFASSIIHGSRNLYSAHEPCGP